MYIAIQGQWEGEKDRGPVDKGPVGPIGVSTLKTGLLENQGQIFKGPFL
jgi:hypothetical protein